MVAILDDGDVQVDDVPFPQLLVIGDAVADHIIDRGADGLGEAVIVERRGNGLLYLDDMVVAQGVQLVCGDASLDMGAIMTSTSAASWPAMRIFSISSGVLILMDMGSLLGPDCASCRCPTIR